MSLLGISEIVSSAANAEMHLADLQESRYQFEKTQEFNHNEAQLAYERELQADSTKYQRQVQDLVRAGLNPMLAVQQSAGSVHSSPASSSTGSIPGFAGFRLSGPDLIAMMRLKMDADKNKADIENTEANTRETEARTEGLVLDNEIKAATKDAVIESKDIENQLTREKLFEVRQGIKESESRIGKLIAETETETDKRALISAQKILADAESRQIIEMLPYSKQLMLAKTEGERNAAILAAAHTAYQNHLIDDGYLDAFIKNMQETADSAEARAALDKIKAALRTGDYSKVGDIVRGNFAKDFMQDMTVLLDNLNPLNNIFK